MQQKTCPSKHLSLKAGICLLLTLAFSFIVLVLISSNNTATAPATSFAGSQVNQFAAAAPTEGSAVQEIMTAAKQQADEAVQTVQTAAALFASHANAFGEFPLVDLVAFAAVVIMGFALLRACRPRGDTL